MFILKRKGLKQIVYRVLPSNKPDFIILGAQKSGTTSLHAYLNHHPQLSGSNPKEIDYFNFDGHYNKGLAWYHSHFKTYKNFGRKKLFYESSPEYLYRSFVPERIYNYNEDLKFIVIMREPVSPAYSAWNMHKDFKLKIGGLPPQVKLPYLTDRENNLFTELYAVTNYPSFEECVNSELKKMSETSRLEEPSFLRKGIYVAQIERYLKFFDKKNFLFLTTKELSKAKTDTLNKVTDFLCVSRLDWSKFNLYIKGKRDYETQLDDAIRQKLEGFYKPHNERLFSMLGHLDW